MTRQAGPIYENTVFVDADTVDEFEQWLAQHIRDAQLPGLVDHRTFAIADDEDGRAGRIFQYQFENDEALDAFIDSAAAEIDAQANNQFGGGVFSTGRVLREDLWHNMPAAEKLNCLNCGAPLRGQYCGTCGQRARSRLISLWELISDAFGDLFELDSRIWQTLIPMIVRPGQLTRDYLRGRRARYMPPFRSYLVLSLIFFLVAFFDPHEELGLIFEPEPEAEPEASAEADADRAAILEGLAEELAAEGIIIGSGADETGEEGDGFNFQIGSDRDEGDEETREFNIQFDDEGEAGLGCEIDESDLEEMPDWLARRLTRERLQHICEQTKLDNGRQVFENLADNIPAALIVLLPLMALVLKLLYPLSRRYYVEHLLFFVHFHAFFFLILTLQILFARLADLLHVPEAISVVTLVVASLYIPVHLFISMRRVYGQGRLATFLKYIVLSFAYFAGFLVTMLGALLIAVFSV